MPTPSKTVVAFLQNQWFKPDSVESVERIYAKYSCLKRRAELNRCFLFYRSLTGKRLRQVFGSLIDEIVWENASPEIASYSAGKFEADPKHILAVIKYWKPDIVMTFGSIATHAVARFVNKPMVLCPGPHPAGRSSTIIKQLTDMKNLLNEQLS